MDNNNFRVFSRSVALALQRKDGWGWGGSVERWSGDMGEDFMKDSIGWRC